jgi:hypothetical protein
MVRTDAEYHADIRTVLLKFYQPGDMLYLVRFFKESRKCQMCGGKVPIWNCYELRNERSGERIICGRNCIVKYAVVLRMIGENPAVLFPDKFREHAEEINRRSPQTVLLEPACEASEDDPCGELCDCGVELSYCEECDNEMCPACERGCTCEDEAHEDWEYWKDEME